MKWTFRFAGIVQGLVLLVDARALIWPSGSQESQPWMGLARFAGFDPAKMGVFLAALGLIWIAVTILVVLGYKKARIAAAAIAFATLWYAWFGTVLSVIYLFALATLRDRTET
jgi:hypothetical protein